MKRLVVDFDVPAVNPPQYYRVQYREVGGDWNTLSPNPTTSPAYITVPEGKNWEGTVEAFCGPSSGFSEPIPWSYNDTGAPMELGLTIENWSKTISVTVTVYDIQDAETQTFQMINGQRSDKPVFKVGHYYNITAVLSSTVAVEPKNLIMYMGSQVIESCPSCLGISKENFMVQGIITIQVK